MEITEVWTLKDRSDEIDTILKNGVKIKEVSCAGRLRVKNYESFTHFQYVPDIVEKVLNDGNKGNNGK